MIQVSNKVMNASEAQMIAAKWAKILVDRLEKTRGAVKK
jgi:hypothetical protein